MLLVLVYQLNFVSKDFKVTSWNWATL